MKKFTHAWLAFMAIKRLEAKRLSLADGLDRSSADKLIEWFRQHRDGVISGAWYPDSLIKDMANSHVLKYAPAEGAAGALRPLPETHLSYKYRQSSPVWNKSCVRVDPKDNLPDRCESIAESVIDHLKIQESEEKGSPVSPTSNQVALLLFMLSHYVADAHMPLHCDGRAFSDGGNIHSLMEGAWDEEIENYYEIDRVNGRFLYDEYGYPLIKRGKVQKYPSSFLKKVEDELYNRKFLVDWGGKNNNVWDFMSAVCQYSYLLSYSFIPEGYGPDNVTKKNWPSLGSMSFPDLSVAVLADAVDAIARIYFRIWRRYEKWRAGG